MARLVAVTVLLWSLPSLGAEEGASAGRLEGKSLLTSRYPEDFLARALLPRAEWRPFPRASDREAWEGLLAHELNRRRESSLVGRAEALLGRPWPPLPATLYMEFARNGNRSRYEKPYFERRENLAALVLAECLEHRGRFLDEIANGIWAICEESSWCLPAHASRRPGDVLHRPDVETIDLFACETGMSLAQTLYLLEAELAALSPALGERIRLEVRRRIIDLYAAGDDFPRSGWTSGYNNWAPWCASNVMGAALYLEEDPERLASIVFRLAQVVDRFVDRYGEDGGCDEGPSYWNEAAGALLVFLELLHSRSGGKIDIYGEPKIAAMGEYIVRAHLAGPWFANFADADPKAEPHPGKVYRFGERVGSESLRSLALLGMREWTPEAPVRPPIRLSGVSRSVLGPLMELFWIPAGATPGELRHETAVWLPDLQVLFARELPEPSRGLVVAAKGGHNAESHNHNDVGHFLVLLDGQPGVIDLGRETYTRQTFSSGRYELWFTRGLGHNAPVVNGIEQRAGRAYAARNVELASSEDGLRLAMDLEAAYPPEAGLRSLRRELAFERGESPRVSVRDTYELEGGPGRLLLPLYAAQETTELERGRLSIACKPRALLLEYDPGELSARVEVAPIEDESLREAWGERVWRLTLELPEPRSAGSYELVFRAAEP